jgi:uncharacterized protein DUF4240
VRAWDLAQLGRNHRQVRIGACRETVVSYNLRVRVSDRFFIRGCAHLGRFPPGDEASDAQCYSQTGVTCDMTLDEFWIIIDRIRDAAPRVPDGKLVSMELELSKLSLAELQSFYSHWSACLARAYTYKLWAAAYMIGGGCSDGAFWDFRSTLIVQGRAFFEAAIADPDCLADANYSEDSYNEDNTNDYPLSDAYNYMADQMLKARGIEEPGGPNPHPPETLGEPWTRQDLPRLLPKLAAKFGFHS